MGNFKKRLSVLIAVMLLVTAFTGWSAFADSLGDKLYGKELLIGKETMLANGVYWNAGYTEKITENYIEYTPGGDVVPIISHGNDVYGAASFKAVAAKAAMEGKYVIAGLNGDFFNMSNGVPTGLTIKDGKLITSESMYNPSVGFFADGRTIIGRANMNIRLDGPTLGTGTGAIHLNKAVTKASGIVLYTRDYADDDTNKAAIPTYNVLVSVDSEDLYLNGTVQATVDSVYNSIGATFIPEGMMLITIASGTDYPGTLAKLMTLVPGDMVSLSFAGDPSWNDVVYAVGGGEKLITAGRSVAPANAEIHPRTAVGIRADGSAVFYTMDGRIAGHSKGSTLSQLANRLLELGCVEAVNMDGGGSTAIHSLYPGDSSTTVVNSPSQSSLRNCANYILLINTATPTGVPGNIHLYPYNLRMLAGATQTFTIKGTDANFYPVEVPSTVLFSATNNLGTFDENNGFTAGKSAGSGQVVAKVNDYIKGTAQIEVVTKPDSVTIVNRTDGKAVANITAHAGEKIDLSAAATYKKLPLYSQAKCYTWTVEGDIGTVDENGIFTAGNISSGTGKITAAAAGVSSTINVNVISEGWRLETFENDTHGFQTQTAKGLSVKVNTDLTKVRFGYKSIGAAYDFAAAEEDEIYLASSLTFARSPGSMSFWVYGDGSGNTLNPIVDTTDGLKEIPGTKLDFKGWKFVAISMPTGTKSLSSIKLVKTGSVKGEIYLDQFIAGIGFYVDMEPPQVQMSINNQTLTAIISDAGDSRISQSKINLTYDGKPLEFQYISESKTLTSTLPVGDGAMHRIALVVSDESGNLVRSGLTIPAAAMADQPFIDMGEHWGRDNTVYLYDRGVVSGVNTDKGLAYNPDKSITRAEFAVLMNNWMGEKAEGYGNTTLPFIDAGAIPAWAVESVKAMYGMGIIMGTGTEKGLVFNPAGPISRQEVMTIIGRTQIRGFAEDDLKGFGDSSRIADWALPYVRTLVKQKVVSGYNGNVWPGNNVTRAEVATIITSLY